MAIFFQASMLGWQKITHYASGNRHHCKIKVVTINQAYPETK